MLTVLLMKHDGIKSIFNTAGVKDYNQLKFFVLILLCFISFADGHWTPFHIL